MPSIDDEEETLCLLADQEESPGPRQPGGASGGSVAAYNQITPSVAWISNGINADDVEGKPLVQLKNDEVTSIANESYLAPGTAERTFFSVCGNNTTSRGYTAGDAIDDDEEDEESDEEGEQRKHLINDQASPTCVRASIKVVNEILTDIEDGADFRSHTAMETLENAHSVSTSTSRSLVVDVHLPPDDHMLRPYKHEINRFQRCYSDGSQSSPKRKGIVSASSATTSTQMRLQDESLQRSSQNKSSLDNDSFQNADKIETIYETDPAGQLKQKRDARFRHSSECTGFGSLPFESTLRGFNFHEEFINLRHNLFEGRQLFFGSGNSDNGSKRKSDSEVEGRAFRSDDLGSTDKCGRYLTEAVADQGKKNLRLGPAFSTFPSAALANSSVIVSTPSPGMSDKKSNPNPNPSPYTFFTMESDDDFDFDGGDKSFEVMDDHPRFSVDFDDHKSTISQSSSTVSMPVCRICQLPSMEPNNHLISPCRCLGSIRYVHNNCLLKWLEVSSKRRNGPACCELCQYQYLRHKKFVITHWRFPECSLKDKILHLFFVISVCLMIACAAVTIICFKEDRGHYRGSNKYHAGELSPPEMITLSCGVLFFLAFFLAMYVEVKARHTVYQLICKFFYLNHEWSVEEYDRKRDLVISKKKKEKLKKKKAENGSTN